MEPRPHERGKAPIEPRQRLQTPGFNGATSSRTWKADRPLESSHCQSGFNGATSSRTWKDATPRNIATLILLQWSHVLTNVESFSVQNLLFSPDVLQWSHVLTNVESRGSSCCMRPASSRFNGATSSRTWKDAAARAGRLCNQIASMEPRPHERGKHGLSFLFYTSHPCFNGATSSRTWKANRRECQRREPNRELQWSHVLTNVERSRATWRALGSDRFNGATSSRTWKEAVRPTTGNDPTALQWSHVLTNVERKLGSPANRGKR